MLQLSHGLRKFGSIAIVRGQGIEYTPNRRAISEILSGARFLSIEVFLKTGPKDAIVVHIEALPVEGEYIRRRIKVGNIISDHLLVTFRSPALVYNSGVVRLGSSSTSTATVSRGRVDLSLNQAGRGDKGTDPEEKLRSFHFGGGFRVVS